jgi:anti-anti-sigma factor
MKIETRIVNDITVLTVHGDFTFNYLDGVRDTLKNAVTSASTAKFLVDLSHAKHVDSSGLGTIVSIFKTVVSRKGTFGVIVLDEEAKEVFYTIGLNKLFPIFESESQAVKSV